MCASIVASSGRLQIRTRFGCLSSLVLHVLETFLQGDFGLSKFQLGLLAAMFMVGLMVASVALTQLTAYISPFRLIGELQHCRQQTKACITISGMPSAEERSLISSTPILHSMRLLIRPPSHWSMS